MEREISQGGGNKNALSDCDVGGSSLFCGALAASSWLECYHATYGKYFSHKHFHRMCYIFFLFHSFRYRGCLDSITPDGTRICVRDKLRRTETMLGVAMGFTISWTDNAESINEIFMMLIITEVTFMYLSGESNFMH